MATNPELSPIVPLKLPNPALKPRRRRISLPRPERFDFDEQRFKKFLNPDEPPRIVPYRRGRMGRIIMLEAA